MRNLSRLIQLAPEERKLLLQALILLPILHVGLKLLGYARVARFIEVWNPLERGRNEASHLRREGEAQKTAEATTGEDSSEIALGSLQRAQATARIVSIAARRGIYRASCLRRSMVLVFLLRRQGIASMVCFGTRLKDHHLEAHAWVEVQGAVVNDRPDVRLQYSPLDKAFPATWTGL
jgi:hypothetical protein